MEHDQLEPPECPVCLNPYDVVSTIPRVLPCGHSTCQACITHLPNPFPNTIRCPSCTHLLNLPNNPSSFPKNFDLLRLSALIQPQLSIPRKVISRLADDDHVSDGVSFIPSLFPHEFFVKWVKWVLPNYVVLIEPSFGEIVKKTCSNGNENSLFGCVLRDGEKVGVVKVGRFKEGRDGNEMFKYSYEAKIVKMLYEMGDSGRNEIVLLLNASLRLCRVGKVYGFWCDEDDDDGSVYMVCERFSGGLVRRMEGLEYGFLGKREEKDGLKRMASFGMIGMEMCEAVSGLHSEGLVIGCLSASCFGFDEFGRVLIDFSEVVEIGRKVCCSILDEDLRLRLKNDIVKNLIFLSPEVVSKLLRKESVELEGGNMAYEVCFSSDVWSLACLLVWLFVGKPFTEEMCNFYLDFFFSDLTDENKDCSDLYTSSIEKSIALVERELDLEFVSVKEILCKCFEFDPRNRPALSDLWKCIRGLVINPDFDVIAGVKPKAAQGGISHCVILGELCRVAKETNMSVEDHKPDLDQEGQSKVDRDVAEGVSGNHVKCIDLKGHLDCITGLTIGGGFLFSSSYDKIVNVWSLEDFSHVHSFKGHEHRVMAVVFVDEGESLCISGDSGGGICIWGAEIPLSQEPIKKLYEQKDWRYSGIHALAVSGTEYLYTGSGDKTIKAWSLQDYTLMCTMSGHKSVVSSLAVSNGVLYSGSWDGTVRLWCLGDHSPLTVLGEDKSGNMSSVLSLAADSHVLVVAHEDGSTKIWHNDALLKSEPAHNGAVFAVIKKGKWLFAGGWDKTISVQVTYLQELSGAAQLEATLVGTIPSGSAITALAYWQGKLFAGQADRVIKVYYSRF